MNRYDFINITLFRYSFPGVVGGSIGLCLGFSFVTGYEVLFFLFDYITAPWKFKQIYNAQNGNAK